MNIGFIGVGSVAQPHLRNLSKLKGVKIVSVCDVFADRAKEVAQEYGARPYSKYRQMLKKESLDACYVCIIPGVHGRTELDLAQARIPFYIEKPVHLNLNACRRVIDEVARSGLVVGVGYHWRYTKASQAAKKYVTGKKVSLVDGAWYGRFVKAPWWRQMKLSGGQILEQTTHIVDMARYLGGEVDSVFASATTGAMTDFENYDIHDASIINLMYENGAIGAITSGCIADDHGGGRCEIYAKGRNWQVFANGGRTRIEDHRGERVIESKQSWPEMLGNGDRAFVSAVRSGKQDKLKSSYADGAQSLAIGLAANKSIKTGRPVKVERMI